MRYKTSKDPLVVISLRISEEEKATLNEIAKLYETTVTEIIRRAIQEFISPLIEMD